MVPGKKSNRGEFIAEPGFGDPIESAGETDKALTDEWHADLEYGQNIEDLKREIQELKVYLATLMRLLVSNGVLRQERGENRTRTIESS